MSLETTLTDIIALCCARAGFPTSRPSLKASVLHVLLELGWDSYEDPGVYKLDLFGRLPTEAGEALEAAPQRTPRPQSPHPSLGCHPRSMARSGPAAKAERRRGSDASDATVPRVLEIVAGPLGAAQVRHANGLVGDDREEAVELSFEKLDNSDKKKKDIMPKIDTDVIRLVEMIRGGELRLPEKCNGVTFGLRLVSEICLIRSIGAIPRARSWCGKRRNRRGPHASSLSSKQNSV